MTNGTKMTNGTTTFTMMEVAMKNRGPQAMVKVTENGDVIAGIVVDVDFGQVDEAGDFRSTTTTIFVRKDHEGNRERMEKIAHDFSMMNMIRMQNGSRITPSASFVN